MSIRLTSFSNPESTISFCEKRLFSDRAQEEMEKHDADCLAPDKRAAYVAFANEGNYNPVLAAIWKDKTNRLDFVRSLENKLHAPIMFEAPILEFTANPTAKTVREVCMPMIIAAVFRVRQDAQCSKVSSVFAGDASHRMAAIYDKSFINNVEKELKDPTSPLFKKYASFQAILDEDKASITAKADEKLLWIARISKETDLPSPNWIAQSVLGVFMDQLYPNLQLAHPPSEYKAIRDAYATKVELENTTIRLKRFLYLDLSPIRFCEQRLYPKKKAAVISFYAPNCLAPGNRDRLVSLVEQGEYIEAIGAIWADRANALDFVRMFEDKLHAPIMFEAAIVEFEANPTIETLFNTSLPLIHMADFRSTQDIFCSTNSDDSSLKNIADIKKIYWRCLKNSVGRSTIEFPVLDSYIDTNTASIRRTIMDAVLKTANDSKNMILPSPKWGSLDGDAKDPGLIDDCFFQWRRNILADVTIEEIETDNFAIELTKNIPDQQEP